MGVRGVYILVSIFPRDTKTLFVSPYNLGLIFTPYCLLKCLNIYRSMLWIRLPHQTRKLLANCSTLASSDGAGTLLLPLLRSFPSGWLPAPRPPSSGTSRACPRDEAESTARRNCQGRRPSRPRRGGKGKLSEGGGKVLISLRAVAGAAVQVSREYQEALRGRGDCGSIGIAGDTNAGVGVGVVGKGALPTFQRWGAVGVLTISVVSSQVELAFGGRGVGCGLLSTEAWTWLHDFFRTPEVCLQVRYRAASFVLSCCTVKFVHPVSRVYHGGT